MDALDRVLSLCYLLFMKKLILTLLLLALPASVLAGGQVVVVKKDCYTQRGPRIVFCRGAVKNIGDTDVRNVVITFISTTLRLAAHDKIDYLSSKDKESFRVAWDGILMSDNDAYRDVSDSISGGDVFIRITYKPVEE